MSGNANSRPEMRVCKPLKLLPGACNRPNRLMIQMQSILDKPLTIVLHGTLFLQPPENRHPDYVGWTAQQGFLRGEQCMYSENRHESSPD